MCGMSLHGSKSFCLQHLCDQQHVVSIFNAAASCNVSFFWKNPRERLCLCVHTLQALISIFEYGHHLSLLLSSYVFALTIVTSLWRFIMSLIILKHFRQRNFEKQSSISCLTLRPKMIRIPPDNWSQLNVLSPFFLFFRETRQRVAQIRHKSLTHRM